MNKITITTLECPELTTIRADGNTTRQCDYAIQKLFQGFRVKVLDHFNDGMHAEDNRFLFSKICKVLKFNNVEHRGVDIITDVDRGTIELNKK